MDLSAAIRDNLVPLVAGLVLTVVVLAVGLVVAARRVAGLSQRLTGLTRGSDERSLEAILEAHLARVHEVVRDLERLERRAALTEGDLRHATSRVGLVRYNPFEDTGGNQSFALTMLDSNADGFVMSSLHSRSGTRIYAKTIAAGRPDGALSNEEAEALALALARPAAGSTAPGSR